MLLPLYLNNLLSSYRLIADVGVYEVVGQDVAFRVNYRFEIELFRQGGAPAFIQVVGQVRPEIMSGAKPSDTTVPEIVTSSAVRRVRPSIMTMHRRKHS